METRRQSVHFPTARLWERTASSEDIGRVAIIMRTKDRPILLPRAFQSMLGQTYRNWHVYLVNDGGEPDPVEALFAAHAEAFDGRITIIHNPVSHGMEAASNLGLSKAQGEFVIVHDDDDTWHPEFLKETVAYLSRDENARFVAVAARPILIHEKISGQSVVELKREEWDAWVPMTDMAHLIARNAFPPICLLIRMAAVAEVGAYNTAMPVLGDWDYNLRLLALGDIATIEHRLAAYHHRDKADQTYGNSVTAGVDNHRIFDVLYRNSLLRASLADPATLGALHTILRMMEEHKNAVRRQLLEQDSLILRVINERFDRLEAKLAGGEGR
jgi:glycosyltransferase involved in cell wall biosynthesis